ncbi:amidohydrolase family protein [Anaerosporobacter faecicola]|uniref:amidohydrolase family protein n=1 Tax=Anaerosporobacter faecicola TaxID=2718714 RepID=UPI001439B28F|nr:amidohydrolase family protein [Anaerosporobacter faecicola]
MIDAHFHYDFTNDSKLDLNNIEKIMNDNSIEKILLHIIDPCLSVKQLCNITWPTNIIPSVMLNPLEKICSLELEKLKNHNIRFVKILPYEQNIDYKDFPKILEYAKKIQEYNMCLVICAAYGSKNIYKTNGIHLAEYLLGNGIISPLIVAHGGMTKVLDTLLLMEEYPNLFMDISFSLYYWWGSTVIQDYAFVIKKMSGKRIFYGSDYPNVTIEQSLNIFKDFCYKYDINSSIQQNILNSNFSELCNSL